MTLISSDYGFNHNFSVIRVPPIDQCDLVKWMQAGVCQHQGWMWVEFYSVISQCMYAMYCLLCRLSNFVCILLFIFLSNCACVCYWLSISMLCCFLSVSVSVCLSLSLSLSLSVCLFGLCIFVSVSACFIVYVRLSLSLSLSLFSLNVIVSVFPHTCHYVVVLCLSSSSLCVC